MLLFLKFLKEQNIPNIKVPTSQTLSYRYHQILSEVHRKDLISLGLKGPLQRKSQNKTTKEDKEILEKYKNYLIWCDHIIGKEDVIHHLKTEKFLNLVKRMPNHLQELEIKEISDNVLTLQLQKTKQLKK